MISRTTASLALRLSRRRVLMSYFEPQSLSAKLAAVREIKPSCPSSTPLNQGCESREEGPGGTMTPTPKTKSVAISSLKCLNGHLLDTTTTSLGLTVIRAVVIIVGRDLIFRWNLGSF